MLKKIVKLSTALMFLLGLTACGGGGADGGGGSGGSHHAGLNCLSSSCHDGTSAAPLFFVGGTAYTSGGGVQTNATITLRNAVTSSVVATLTTDASGNFYSTSTISAFVSGMSGFEDGADVTGTGPAGSVIMPGTVSSGTAGCNQSTCHDSSNRIIIN